MVQKKVVLLEDDLDGGQADETVSFSLDGVAYEIDLSAKNAGKLRDQLRAYVEAGRRTGGRATRGRRRATTGRVGGQPSTSDVRAWAREQGLEVSERGRIPAGIVEQYEKAHK